MPAHQPESPDPERVRCAHEMLAHYEVRRISIDGQAVVGIWSDQDSPAIRAALKVVGWDELPVKYLDSADVPVRFKGSRLSSEPVPLRVLAAMQAASAEPWKIRDELLAGVRWYDSWEEWMREQRRRAFANKDAPPLPETEPAVDGRSARGIAIDERPPKPIDPNTGIWPIAHWGAECGRGFISNARFGSWKVISRTNRDTTRKRIQTGQKVDQDKGRT
jgi:hypothetical protein